MKRWPTGRLIRAMLLPLLLGLHPANAAASDELILEVHPEKNRVYLHEAVGVTVTLLAGPVSIRNIQYPRLDGAAFRTTEFAPPRQTSIARNGREYTAYEFSATLAPNKIGEIELGPADLRCELLDPGSGAAAFFGGSEPRAVTVRSKPVRFSVLPLPTRGQPAGYSGAVGRFTVNRQVTPTVIQSGDPITVTTRIEGVGNIDSFSCNSISLSGVRSYPPRTRQTGNRLSCEQVLLPEGRVEIPAASISFFDPLSERYKTRKSRPIELEVSAPPGTATVAPPVKANPNEKTDTSVPTPWTGLAAGSLLLAAIFFLAWRQKRKSTEKPPLAAAANPSVATWLAKAEQALAENDPASFHTAVFRALQEHLAACHGLRAAAITGEIVARVLRPAGMEEPLLQTYAVLFRICDRTRFGPRGMDGEGMLETLRLLREATGQDQERQ